MNEFIVAAISALWFGILTSISPCPLATNITAISYISGRMSRPRDVFLTGLLYTAGRTFTYVVIGALITWSVLSAVSISNFLQEYMNLVLGPVLIITGMLLLQLIGLNLFSGSFAGDKIQNRAGKMGIWGGALLGIVFALSFCPVSAGLFFVSLFSLSIKFESAVLLPACFGIGTGLPVFVFAFLIAFGARSIGRIYDRVAAIEHWTRRITGVIFILVGIYYSLIYIFEI